MRQRIGEDAMVWRWPWQRLTRVTEPSPAGCGFCSREVWADLTRPDAVFVQAAEVAARQARDLAALELVLNEPTVILDRPLMTRGQRQRGWGGGQS